MSQQAMAPPVRSGAVTTSPGQPPRRGTWSRQLTMTAQPSAAPWARRMLRHLLREWQLEPVSDTALLLVSELITNAVAASGPDGPEAPAAGRPMIALTVRCTAASLLLEVWDPSPAPPVPQEADLSGDCGRGLLIVECLADQWGHRAADRGKVVWCEVALP